MVHEFLANMEVLVEMAPWSELGERTKVVGHCIFPFESRSALQAACPTSRRNDTGRTAYCIRNPAEPPYALGRMHL
jgi:hypothetical protein